jgi:hypothetical protein
VTYPTSSTLLALMRTAFRHRQADARQARLRRHRADSAPRRARPGFGDEQGYASWRRATPFCVARPARRARSLAATRSAASTNRKAAVSTRPATPPLKGPRRLCPELADRRRPCKHTKVPASPARARASRRRNLRAVDEDDHVHDSRHDRLTLTRNRWDALGVAAVRLARHTLAFWESERQIRATFAAGGASGFAQGRERPWPSTQRPALCRPA